MRMTVVNLFAGPGAGKSTLAAESFAKLKKQGRECELVTEYAKDKYWDNHHAIFENQVYIFAKQLQRIRRLDGRVEFVITDSPLLLQKHYYMASAHTWTDRADELYLEFITEVAKSFNNVNIFLERNLDFEYQEEGRFQTFEEAMEVDKRILNILDDSSSQYTTLPVVEGVSDRIVELALQDKELPF